MQIHETMKQDLKNDTESQGHDVQVNLTYNWYETNYSARRTINPKMQLNHTKVFQIVGKFTGQRNIGPFDLLLF